MTPYYEHAGITIYHGDCREILPQIESCDLVLTDPPYSNHVHSKSMRGAAGWKGPISESRELGFEPITTAIMEQVGQWCATSVTRWTGVFSDTESAHLWRAALCDCVCHFRQWGTIPTAHKKASGK